MTSKTKSAIEKQIAPMRAQLIRMPDYSDRWYSMLADIAALTREWVKAK